MHKRTLAFREAYQALPSDIRDLADSKFRLLKQNHLHPSLYWKPMGNGYVRVRVGRSYRAIAVERGVDYVWIWIGHRQDFETYLRNHGL